jgi:hypothetical protein
MHLRPVTGLHCKLWVRRPAAPATGADYTYIIELR